MCKDFCRKHRYTRRHLVKTSGAGFLGASMTGALLASPWTGSTRAMQDPAQVTWWTEPDDLEFKQQMLDQFQEENHNVQIVMEPISGEDRDRVIATALQAGAGPDIVPSSGPAHA